MEITGVPITHKQIVKEIGSLIGVEIKDSDIAAAHKLPDSKKVKNRMIFKFLQRDKREEVYKKRKNLVEKRKQALNKFFITLKPNSFKISSQICSLRKHPFLLALRRWGRGRRARRNGCFRRLANLALVKS